jgi:uncharacterized protein (DUF362 family)
MEISSKNLLIDNIYEHSFETFTRLLTRLGHINKLSSAKTIVIKPNFAAGAYIQANSHVVSDIAFLLNMIKIIKCLNSHAKIMIAESDSTQYGYAFLKFSNLGIDKWNIPGVTTLDISRDTLKRVHLSNAQYFNSIERQLWLSETLLEADYFISTANFKSHSITLFSGACKNLFGLLPTMNKEYYHTRIHDVIHDLTIVRKIDLSIVDGFYGLEKNGPVHGIPINLGYRIFSNSPVNADIFCCKAIGLNYKKIKYLRLLYPSLPFKCEEGIEQEIHSRITLPTFGQRFFNAIGLTVQSIGRFIYNFGHKIHCADSPLILFIIIFKPVLLKFFELTTLKKWKRKLFNQN